MEQEDIDKIAKKIVEIQKDKEKSILESKPINYKPLGENLQDGMKELNSGIRGIPHIVIGKSDDNTTKNELFSKKEALWIEKIKKWGLLTLVAVIIIYAVVKIIGVIL